MTKMVCLGDSIMQGWDGHKTVATPIPQMIGQINGWEVTNLAIGGTKLYGGDNSFTSMVIKNRFESYDYALIGYGVNDYTYPSGSIDDIKKALSQGIQGIKAANLDIKILIELPTQDFRKGVISLDTKNSREWSQNDLCDAIIEVAKANDCAYYDWRPAPLITNDNRTITLGDSEVHPTFDTMQAMAKVLATSLASIKNNGQPAQPTSPSDPGEQPTTPIIFQKITLSLLDDGDFSFCKNVEANASQVLSFIDGLYAKLPPFFRPASFSVEPLSNPGENASDRLKRQYLIKELLSLGSTINELISTCNRYHVVNLEGFQPTSMLLTDPPRSLDFQSIKAGLNREYQKIENKLNELAEYIASFA